jgi:2-C-methyl-D-erythritol 4-phosphate cytidylyltransferase
MGGAAGTRKQYLEIDGEPVLLRALRPFLAHPGIVEVVVVLPADDLADPPRWLLDLPVTRVAGGAERGDSVWNGLAALSADVGLVLVHDGARPFVAREVIDRVLARAPEGGALAAVPAIDTLKEVDGAGRVVATVDRARIWHAQTPQGFPVATLRAAYERARREGWRGTDDASLCERCGVPIVVVEGSRDNLKITTPADLPVARAIAARLREGSGERISAGFIDRPAIPMPMTDESPSDPVTTTFNLLFVCTGNTCRSPMAEAVARAELEKRGWRHVQVASAGSAAEAGSPAAPEAVAVAARRGLDLDAHRSQLLTPELVDWADLILAMSPSHLAAVARLGGEGRMALLGDFAVEEGMPGDPVPDPLGGDEAVYEETIAELDRMIGAMMDRLAPILHP